MTSLANKINTWLNSFWATDKTGNFRYPAPPQDPHTCLPTFGLLSGGLTLTAEEQKEIGAAVRNRVCRKFVDQIAIWPFRVVEGGDCNNTAMGAVAREKLEQMDKSGLGFILPTKDWGRPRGSSSLDLSPHIENPRGVLPWFILDVGDSPNFVIDLDEILDVGVWASETNEQQKTDTKYLELILDFFIDQEPLHHPGFKHSRQFRSVAHPETPEDRAALRKDLNNVVTGIRLAKECRFRGVYGRTFFSMLGRIWFETLHEFDKSFKASLVQEFSGLCKAIEDQGPPPEAA